MKIVQINETCGTGSIGRTTSEFAEACSKLGHDSYMSYGLPVVSTRGESIVKSKVADLITFSDNYSGESVAKAIRNADIKASTVYLKKLDDLKKEFLTGIDKVLSSRGKNQ